MTYIIVFISVFFFLSIIYSTYKLGISPAPSSRKAIKGIKQLLPVEIQGDIYELGSGWGHLAYTLSQSYPKNHVIGIEGSFVPYFLSQGFRIGRSNLSFEYEDFFNTDLSSAGLILCYLYPDAMDRLKTKFEQELKKGTYIISSTFAVPGWTPVKTATLDDIYGSKVYLYRI